MPMACKSLPGHGPTSFSTVAANVSVIVGHIVAAAVTGRFPFCNLKPNSDKSSEHWRWRINLSTSTVLTGSSCGEQKQSQPDHTPDVDLAESGAGPDAACPQLDVLDVLAHFLTALPYHLYTLFLFTKSDFKTTVIPITFLAAASTPLHSLSFPRLLHSAFWIWLHVLQFDVSNQTQDPAEDASNKSDRPLPAHRISLRAALILRWALVPLCFLLSAVAYGRKTLMASVALVALTVLYDELGAHRGHWCVRNAVNAAGFASFEIGAALVASPTHHNLDGPAQLGIFLSALIFLSTIQAQDFKDVAGDSLIGRRTLPIVYPSLARPSLAFLLVAWSGALSALWGLDEPTSCAFCCVGVITAYTFVRARGVKDDQRAFYVYNAWLTFAHFLPVFWRLRTSDAVAAA